MPPTPFQAWLDIVRAERGLTLHDLARQLGISATTVFHYRLWATASAHGTSLETAMRDALRIALPRTEPRARR